MKLAFLVLCLGILVGPPVVAGEDAVPPRTHQGWGWLVWRGLARLAMANEPATVGENVARIAGVCSSDAGVVAAVRARAKYLEDTFYPEVRAAFALAGQLGVDPLDLRGSASGAIGCPQFLPS